MLFESLQQRLGLMQGRSARTIIIAIAAAMILALGWWLFPHIHRKPPSIFDTPVDDVLSYLAGDDFDHLSIEERLKYLGGILERFGKMGQNDSVVASAFLAGLSGPSTERLVQNARLLGKDILVQGANEFFAITNKEDRAQFLDAWVIKYVRFASAATGQASGRSDEEILNRLTRQANRDVERQGEVDARLAQEMIDFWERDIAMVSTPKEQGQLMQFLPALRDHILNRKSN